MNIIIYFLVAIVATTIGAAAGIGGGVIIKPVLDAVSSFSLPTVNLLSSSTIFIMSIVSIGKQLMKKDKIDIKRTTIIAGGSILGGIVGQKLLKVLVLKVPNKTLIMNIQSIMLIILLLFVFLYMNKSDKFKKYNLKSSFVILILGVILGAIAAFLGIGGGPINVAIFTIFFNMEARDAARNSIVVILFSQGAKILSIACTTGFSSYNLSVLPVMLIGGVLGGFIGYRLNKTISEKNILKIFNSVLILIVLLNIYNIF